MIRLPKLERLGARWENCAPTRPSRFSRFGAQCRRIIRNEPEGLRACAPKAPSAPTKKQEAEEIRRIFGGGGSFILRDFRALGRVGFALLCIDSLAADSSRDCDTAEALGLFIPEAYQPGLFTGPSWAFIHTGQNERETALVRGHET